MKIKPSPLRQRGQGFLILRGGHHYSTGKKYVPIDDIGFSEETERDATDIDVACHKEYSLSIRLQMTMECFEYFRRLAQKGHTIDLSEYCGSGYRHDETKKIKKNTPEYNMLVGAKPFNPSDIFTGISKRQQIAPHKDTNRDATIVAPADAPTPQTPPKPTTNAGGSGYSAEFWAKEKKRMRVNGMRL